MAAFVYDGLNPARELSGGSSPSVNANLMTGLAVDEYFSRTDSSGDVSSFLANALGSTVGLVNSRDSIATSYVYAPFGSDRKRRGQRQSVPVHRPRKRWHRTVLLPRQILEPDVSEIHCAGPDGIRRRATPIHLCDEQPQYIQNDR